MDPFQGCKLGSSGVITIQILFFRYARFFIVYRLLRAHGYVGETSLLQGWEAHGGQRWEVRVSRRWEARVNWRWEAHDSRGGSPPVQLWSPSWLSCSGCSTLRLRSLGQRLARSDPVSLVCGVWSISYHCVLLSSIFN
ncbi:hypothetical protein VPH35_007775 [Triticum aestivum]